MQDILKKIKFKNTGVVLNAPPGLEKNFLTEGLENSLSKYEKSLFTLVFLKSKKELSKFLQSQLNKIKPDSVFWIGYPKQAGQIKSDIHRDVIRLMVEEFGLHTVAAISIDDTWSALRLRPAEKMGS